MNKSKEVLKAEILKDLVRAKDMTRAATAAMKDALAGMGKFVSEAGEHLETAEALTRSLESARARMAEVLTGVNKNY